MTEPLYRIVFRGEIAPGVAPEQVRENLRQDFRLRPESVERLFAGRAVVLKANLDRDTAERYRAAFERTGARCRLEPMVPAAAAAVAPAEADAASVEPTPPAPAEVGAAPAVAAEEERGTTAASAGPPAAAGAHLSWLYRELPQLVAAGVLSEAAAERIRGHYDGTSAPAAAKKTPLALVICAILGSLLVGLGIILLFAHNWEELSRPARTALSFAPLLLGQALAGWAIARRPDSRAWQEGASTFLLVAVGASIALVGQTYHIAGDLPRFVLTWMLLGLPLVYLMRSATAAALFWVGVTCWAGIARFEEAPTALYWLLVLLPAPFFAALWRTEERRIARAWLLWVLALCLAFAVGFTLRHFSGALTVSVYGLLFSLYYLLDRLWLAAGESVWGRPLRLLGCAGIVALGLALSYRMLWSELGLRIGFAQFHQLLGPNLLTLLLAGNLGLLGYYLWRSRRADGLCFGLAGLFILLCQLAAPSLPHPALAWLFSLFLLLLGGSSLLTGFRQGRLAKVNGGLGIISLLIVARFFDSRLPFTAKGIAFITVGIGFLLANLLAKRKEVAACE